MSRLLEIYVYGYSAFIAIITGIILVLADIGISPLSLLGVTMFSLGLGALVWIAAYHDSSKND